MDCSHRRLLCAETRLRPPRTAEELDEAYANIEDGRSNGPKFTEEESYEIARRHHWRVVVNALDDATANVQGGAWFCLKGKDLSWQEASDKLTDETDGNYSGSIHKWASIVFWEAETGAYSRAVVQHLKQMLEESCDSLGRPVSAKDAEAVIMPATGKKCNTDSPAEVLMRVDKELDWEWCVKNSRAGVWKKGDTAYVQQQQARGWGAIVPLIAAGDSTFRLVSKLSGPDVKKFEKVLRKGYSPAAYEERLRQSEEQLSAAHLLFARNRNLSNAVSYPPGPNSTTSNVTKMAPTKNPPRAVVMRKGQPKK